MAQLLFCDAGGEIRDHGNACVADLRFTGELALRYIRHADYVSAPHAVCLDLCRGLETRPFRADVGPLRV